MYKHNRAGWGAGSFGMRRKETIDQRDLDVTVTHDSVPVAGEKRRKEEKDERGYYRHETSVAVASGSSTCPRRWMKTGPRPGSARAC